MFMLFNVDSVFFLNSLVSVNQFEIASCWHDMWYYCKDLLCLIMVLKLN